MKRRKQLPTLAPAILLLATACMAIALAVGLHLLQMPREIDTAIGKRAPGKIRDAYASTVRTVSVLGDDKYVYRLICYDLDMGRIFKKDIPIPEEIWRGDAADQPQLRDVDEVTFSGNGEIVWSADGNEVTFLVRGKKIFRYAIR